MASFKPWLISKGIIIALAKLKQGGTIKEVGDNLEVLCKKENEKGTVDIQTNIVSLILLPLAKYLLREEPLKFRGILVECAGEIREEEDHG